MPTTKRSPVLRWLSRLLLALLLGPALLVLLLRWLPPPTSSVIVQARVAAWQADQPPGFIRQQWLPLTQIAPALQLAVIAAEDQTFDRHWGFDLQSIQSALLASERGRRLRGASTLSQQVAKNLFLWHGRSWLRKGMEVYLTGWIELLWPKRRILEVYLNLAQFSARDYGAAAASTSMFHTAAARLTEQQAALLAASLPNPVLLRADAPSDYLWSRADWIRSQMRQLGYGYLDGL
jgi:monofunctional biosynthetic peptidoglycan transglycosylase